MLKTGNAESRCVLGKWHDLIKVYSKTRFSLHVYVNLYAKLRELTLGTSLV